MRADTKKSKEGVVVEAYPGLQFKVDIDGKSYRCHLNGKMRLNWVKVVPRHKVPVIISGEFGRIFRRL